MNSVLDISTSALVAQRLRLNTISSNLANMSTMRNEKGEVEAYQPRFVVFQTDDEVSSPAGGHGVSVSSVEFEDVKPLVKFQPGHPDANEEGYVEYPNIDMTEQFVDAMQATRAYEANIGVIEVTKDISQQTLRILA